MPPTTDAPAIPVNTKRVKDRRPLRFASLDEAVAEADRLVQAERSGDLCSSGNWTLGQALGHVAAWMTYPLDGYPPEVRPPWFVRIGGRLIKRRVLNSGMPAGLKIPRINGGTIATDQVDSEEGLRRLQTAAARLAAQAPAIPNPMFGRLTHVQWIELNLRHCELHMGFFMPKNRG